jgi:ketosteroid isomerase-like protein
MTMAVKGITAEGDRVAVEAVSHAVGKSPAGGSDIEITNFYHLVFFLRDGKITKIPRILRYSIFGLTRVQRRSE